MLNAILITERGFAAHFIASHFCRYRRNTLIEYSSKKLIVSSVGNMWIPSQDTVVEIGYRRWYETMAFWAEERSGYWKADIDREIDFESEWGIFTEP